ncbi:STAS/SEC14 domain-containing protein [Hyphomonas sp.]|uniref:STAS/SEC14 domain-containing protein n=1 Tax=Hyphomonas sp. TaxID=87 RepID=UPI0025BF299B|nr:STAS/SEC14 domain-containing protein [Hyphomonas sp.]
MPYTIQAETELLTTIDAQGELNPDAMPEAVDQLMETTSEDAPGGLLVRLQHMDLGSLHTVASDWSRKAEFFALQKRFGKVAVLTDQPWVRQSAKMQAVALPDTELKVYDLADEVDARVWLEKVPAEAA